MQFGLLSLLMHWNNPRGVIGDPHHLARRLVDHIRAVDPIHDNCFFQVADMPVARARRLLARFVTKVLPLDRIGLRPPSPAPCTRAA